MAETGRQMMDGTPLARFNQLDPVDPDDLVGLWRGSEHPSGHPLDGVLTNLGWFGKRFHPDRRADALLFQAGPGRLIPVDPRFVPLDFALRAASFGRSRVARNWFSYLQKPLRARGPTASLKMLHLDGTPTAAMVYDRQPITDYFRRIDPLTIFGMMCIDGHPQRYFFTLQKEDNRLPGSPS